MKILFFLFLAIYNIYILKTNKDNRFLLFLSVLLLGYVFSFNTDNNDYDAYLSFYEGLRQGSMEYINYNSNSSPLFTYSMFLAKYLGLGFNGYRLLIFGLCFIISSVILKKSRCGYFIAAYGLLAFFFDLVQLRFTLALFPLLLAFYYLVKGRKYVYVALVVISALFHSMTIVYLPLVFIPLNDKLIALISKKVYWAIGIMMLATIISAPIIGLMQQFVAVFSLFDEYSRYMEHEARYGYLLYFAYQASNLLIAKILYEKCSADNNSYEEQQMFIKFNLVFQVISLLFIFSAMLNVNFSRFIRISYMVNLIAFSYCGILRSQQHLDGGKVSQLCIFSYLFLNGIWLLGETIANGAYGNIVNLVFESF